MVSEWYQNSMVSEYFSSRNCLTMRLFPKFLSRHGYITLCICLSDIFDKIVFLLNWVFLLLLHINSNKVTATIENVKNVYNFQYKRANFF